MQINPQLDIATHRAIAKLWRMTIPSVVKKVGEVELSFIAGGKIKWDNHFGKQFDYFLKR